MTKPDLDPVSTLAAALERHRGGRLLVVTGAGVSLASGIPTFRGKDPGAIWQRDVLEMGTNDFFRREPASSWRWYLERFDGLRDKVPNPAHHALVELEAAWADDGDGFLLVTQNVDLLHERAGSRRLVKIHGSADRVRCSRLGCEHGAPRGTLPREEVDFTAFRAEPEVGHLPRCPGCGALLRPHVLWFDEYYQEHDGYQLERTLEAGARAELVLFVGTSFSVGITDLLLSCAWRGGAEVLAVDPGGAARGHLPGVGFLASPAEELLPAAVACFTAHNPRRW